MTLDELAAITAALTEQVRYLAAVQPEDARNRLASIEARLQDLAQLRAALTEIATLRAITSTLHARLTDLELTQLTTRRPARPKTAVSSPATPLDPESAIRDSIRNRTIRRIGAGR